MLTSTACWRRRRRKHQCSLPVVQEIDFDVEAHTDASGRGSRPTVPKPPPQVGYNWFAEVFP